ncbi:MAG: glutamyl-tRNA reductase [Ignavibacteria bacterium]|jgi:glutamyl-tRNA reductase
MNLLAISLNHRTADIKLREALFINEDEIRTIIQSAKDDLLKEGLIISTCNRTELYGIPANLTCNHAILQNFITTQKNSVAATSNNFETFTARESLGHLFSVITGIDSLLIGDNQIFKQVKDSIQIADEMQFTGFIMRKVFDSAIRVGRRAITETKISEGAVTVSYAAVQLIEKIFSNLSKKTALVIGTGETGEIAAKNLVEKGIAKLTLTNRTTKKAKVLANKLNCSVLLFDDFKEHLHEFDIIMSATSSDDIIINEQNINSAIKRRNYEPMVLMDIAVPRDIDPVTQKIDYVFYHDIDSLNIIVEQNLAKRKSEIPKVKNIIEEELDSFFEWYNSLQSAPTIKNLREHFDAIRAEEVEKNINKFSEQDKEKLEIVTKRIINKILHHPTIELKKINPSGTGAEEAATKIGIIRNLFGIDKSTPDEKEK